MSKIGIDIVKISRIKNATQRSTHFVEKIFTDREVEYFSRAKNKYESMAACFAAKEAFLKMLGIGIFKFDFRDIEVLHNENGMPYIELKHKPSTALLSISHEDDMAIVVVFSEAECAGLLKSSIFFEMKKILPKRKSNSNKGDFGKIFIVAGSKGMTGAATLSAMGALKSGGGLVTVGTAETEQPILACKLTEAMTIALSAENGIISENAKELILERTNKSDILVIGPGLGQSDAIYAVIYYIITNTKSTVLIDADGINALSKNIDILREKTCNVILTPHPGEMSRLCKKSIAEIQENREQIAKDFAMEYAVTLVLKGENTVVADKNGEIYVNDTGNPGMATGGTGDVLSGVIGAFEGQLHSPFYAAKLGTFVHGAAGDIVAKEKGFAGLIASDVAEAIPYIMRELEF